MSDDIKHEQPSAGGSFIRQPDGSLARNEEKPAVKESKPPSTSKKS
ncbi:hypothetical protein [Bradyrhizobium sp. LA2.1]